MRLFKEYKNKLKRTWTFHPLFLGLYFALFPFAQNIDEIGLEIKFTHFRSFIIVITIVIMLTLLIRMIIREELQSAIMSSVVVFYIFSYGHVISFLYSHLNLEKSHLDYLLIPLWILLCVISIRWLNKAKRNMLRINQGFNYMSFVLFLFPLYTLILYAFFIDQTLPQIDPYLNRVREAGNLSDINQVTNIANNHTLPDIYYIILDGYTRADVLQQYFDYDNSIFLDFLSHRGFYIAELSSSNYTLTNVSISSSLNMSHVNDFPDYLRSINPKFDNFNYMNLMGNELVDKSLVISLLRDNGDEIVSFDSGVDLTRLKTGDVYLSSPKVQNQSLDSALELIILDSTIGGFFRRLRGDNFVPVQKLYDEHRERILFTLENLPTLSERDGPQFVLAHIICPHPPYVFTATGEPIYNSEPFTLVDLNAGGSWSPELYSNQVEFIN